MKKFIIFLLIWSMFLTSCSMPWSKQDTTPIKEIVVKDLNYYKSVFSDFFLNLENSQSNFQKTWLFNFELTLMAQGNTTKILPYFKKDFTDISVSFDWNYDVIDSSNPKGVLNIKAYLNKRNIGLWDFDLTFESFWSGSIAYTINNISPDILSIFVWEDTSNRLVTKYKTEIWKQQNIQLSKEKWDSYVSSVDSSVNKSALVQNTKDQEQQIINLFLKDEVIQILSGEDKNWMDALSFKWNTDNFINFINDTAKVLNEKKEFNTDKEILKNINMTGILYMKNKNLEDSDINTNLSMQWKWSGSWQIQQEILVNKSELKIIDPRKLNFDFTNLMFSQSSPDNKLQIRIKGLVK